MPGRNLFTSSASELVEYCADANFGKPSVSNPAVGEYLSHRARSYGDWVAKAKAKRCVNKSADHLILRKAQCRQALLLLNDHSCGSYLMSLRFTNQDSKLDARLFRSYIDKTSGRKGETDAECAAKKIEHCRSQ